MTKLWQTYAKVSPIEIKSSYLNPCGEGYGKYSIPDHTYSEPFFQATGG